MKPPDMSRRASTIELMDTEELEFEDYLACLRDLERVNWLTVAYRPTLVFLDRLAASGRLPGDRPLEIVDIGSGYGDMLRRIGIWAKRRGIDVELTGVDSNPRAAQAARAATGAGGPIRWVTSDIFAYRHPSDVDVLISSLFAHHLDDRSVVRLLVWMEETARLGWFVNDLHRHKLPYVFFRAWSRVAGWHRFVRHDGPVSISRAFTAADWRRYLDQADMPGRLAEVGWWMPFRLCVARVRKP